MTDCMCGNCEPCLTTEHREVTQWAQAHGMHLETTMGSYCQQTHPGTNCGTYEHARDQQIAMQTWCVHCGIEQYDLNVYAVSTGKTACTWCHKPSYEMTDQQYRSAMRRLTKPWP